MASQEWDGTYASIMAMASVIFGATSVALALLMVQRSQAGVSGMRPPTGVDVDVPKVRYSDDQVFVEVRDPGNWYKLQDFVQPDDPWVRQIVGQII